MSMKAFWNEKAETMSRDELAACQSARLRELVKSTFERSPAFRGKMDKAGLKPADIKAAEDLGRLPFMSKEDFRVQYPLGMLCAEREDLR